MWENKLAVLPKNASNHKNQQILSVQQKMQVVLLTLSRKGIIALPPRKIFRNNSIRNKVTSQ